MRDIAVGDTVTTVDQLTALPVGTVIRSEGGLVAERDEPPFPWEALGDKSMTHDQAAHHGPWTVLYLPTPPPVTEITVTAIVDVFERDPHYADLALGDANSQALAALGDRTLVTVTVRRKDTDDE